MTRRRRAEPYLAPRYLNPGSVVVVNNSTLSSNTAIYDYGGAIAVVNHSGVAISGSVLAGNTASLFGGAIYTDSSPGGGVAITASTLSSNSAYEGGALFGLCNACYSDSVISAVDSTFSGNSANYGGAVYGGVTVSNSTLYGNRATSGGGIYAASLNNLTNSTLVDNQAGAGLPRQLSPGELHL